MIINRYGIEQTKAVSLLASRGVLASVIGTSVATRGNDRDVAQRAEAILRSAKKADGEVENEADDETEKLKQRCKQLEEENRKLRKKSKTAEDRDDDGGKAIAATRRHLARAKALRASGDLSASELTEIDQVIADCNRLLEGKPINGGRSPGPHARSGLPSLATLPDGMRRIVMNATGQRDPSQQARAEVDFTGIGLDPDFDPATAADMLRDLEGR